MHANTHAHGLEWSHTAPATGIHGMLHALHEVVESGHDLVANVVQLHQVARRLSCGDTLCFRCLSLQPPRRFDELREVCVRVDELFADGGVNVAKTLHQHVSQLLQGLVLDDRQRDLFAQKVVENVQDGPDEAVLGR